MKVSPCAWAIFSACLVARATTSGAAGRVCTDTATGFRSMLMPPVGAHGFGERLAGLLQH